MNLMLLKYSLTIVFKKKREKKRDEKMACQRSMTQKRERKDGILKKHDPTNKVRHEKEHVFICALA